MRRLALLAIIVAGFSGCRHHDTPPPVPPASSRILTVPVRSNAGVLTRTLLGQVAFDPSFLAQVMSRVPALSVESIRAFPGDHVRKGETVYVLQSPAFLSAEAELASVMNARSGPAMIHGIRSLAEQKLRLMGASEKEIVRLEATRHPVDRYAVRSPISGTIVRSGPAEGSQVKTGDLLFEVSDLAHLWVQAFLYPGEEQGIRPGLPVTVTPLHEPGISGTGRVVRIAPFIDPATKTIPLRISLGNPLGLFRPESWVRIGVPVRSAGSRPTYLVPSRAVVRYSDRRTAVFVVSGPGPPRPVPVTVLGVGGGETVVSGPLRVGMGVVVSGLLPLISAAGK